MTLQTFDHIEQGSGEWHDVRRGLATASVVGTLITSKTMKPADNDASRTLTMLLAAERITGFTEDTYVSADMERGTFDEPRARDHYSEYYARVVECGFMIRDDWGFPIGYSPDGLVGDDGLIEVKSRRQKAQLKTFLTGEVPAENMAQIQCGLLVSRRAWCDYLSWCGGMPMFVKRVLPDPVWQAGIIDAVRGFEESVTGMITDYELLTSTLPVTERVELYPEMRF